MLCDDGHVNGDVIGAPMLGEKTLERLVEICIEDGVAVLEMADTGEIFVAQKQDDGSADFVLWKVERNTKIST